MKKLYEGTLDKLDYAVTKLKNIVDDYFYEGMNNKRFTPNAQAAETLESDLMLINEIISQGCVADEHWTLVQKYIAIAEEFRAAKAG